MPPFYTTENFSPDRSIGYLVRRVHQLGFMALDPVFEADGITGAQWSALTTIYLRRGASAAALAREVGYDTGAMTRIVDQLVERGLVERRRDDADRRVVNLNLTDEGRVVTMRCKAQVIERWNSWLDGWTDAEFDQLVAGLTRLKGRIETLTAMEAAA